MLTFHDSFESPLVRVSEFTCCSRRHAPMVDEEATGNTIVLLREGVFEQHFGRLRVTADPNQVLFFTRGSTYKVGHPADGGDRGTVLDVAPAVLTDLVCRHDPKAEAQPDRPFRYRSGPNEPHSFAQHRMLLALLNDPVARLDRIALETAALELCNSVIRAASAAMAMPAPRTRVATARAHRDQIERTKAHLASRLGESHSLTDVGRAVGCSPFHLSRLFRAHTGMPIHRYLVTLRLRAALDRIADGDKDLSSLAVELGFASHSHFTDAFHEYFGAPPSHLRRGDPRRALSALLRPIPQ